MSEIKAVLAAKRQAFLAKAEDDGSPKTAQEPLAEAETTHTPSEPPAGPPAPRKRAAKAPIVKDEAEKMPWETADPRIPAHFTIRAKAPLHAKLVYVTQHSMGRASQHAIAMEILEQGLDERLRAMGFEPK